MIADNHWRFAAGAAGLAAAGAVALGAPPLLAAGLIPYTAAAALGPDIDKPPEGGKAGACAAEAHGFASNALAELVSATHRGHRGLTHRYPYAVAVGLLVAGLSLSWPGLVAFVLAAWWWAWPLYCSMPYRRRWSAALLAPALAGACWWAGALPADPIALGAAVGAGWALHIWCDRWQSKRFEIGGAFEHAVAYVVLGAGAAALAWSVVGSPAA